MLTITVGLNELFDETQGKFTSTEGVTISLEHSLVSVSKWESKYEVPFLAPGTKTEEQVLAYIEMMIVSPGYPADILERLTQGDIDKINEYIDSKQSATVIRELHKPRGKPETITSELVYYWMITYNIPFAVENWHLNRLFSLVRICNLKNSKPTKMSRSALAAQRNQLNNERRAALNSSG